MEVEAPAPTAQSRYYRGLRCWFISFDVTPAGLAASEHDPAAADHPAILDLMSYAMHSANLITDARFPRCLPTLSPIPIKLIPYTLAFIGREQT